MTLKWTAGQGKDKNQWMCPKGRIKQIDNVTFACWAGPKYLGSEKTLKLAQARVGNGKLSDRNIAIAAWEKKGGQGKPPVPLTKAELAEHHMRYPPVKAAKPIDPVKAPKRAALAGVGTPTPKGRGRTTDVPTSGIIRVKQGATVPKKPGTAPHARWTTLWGYDGKDVAAYAKAGHNMETLRNAIAGGYVNVE